MPPSPSPIWWEGEDFGFWVGAVRGRLTGRLIFLLVPCQVSIGVLNRCATRLKLSIVDMSIIDYLVVPLKSQRHWRFFFFFFFTWRHLIPFNTPSLKMITEGFWGDPRSHPSHWRNIPSNNSRSSIFDESQSGPSPKRFKFCFCLQSHRWDGLTKLGFFF